MREYSVLEGRVGQVSHHCNLKHSHQLTTFDAQDSAAQYLFRFDVNHRLHEAARLAHLDGPCDATHRQLLHASVQALVPGFCFGDPDPTELGIYEDCVRNQPLLGARMAAFKQVLAKDAEVIVKNVRKAWTTFTATQSIDSRYFRLEPIIHLDKPVPVSLYTRRLQVE